MSLGMGVMMSMLMTVLNLGIENFSLQIWFKGFKVAWPIAFLVSFFIGGPINKITDFICNKLL